MKIPKEYQDRYMWPKWLRMQLVNLQSDILLMFYLLCTLVGALIRILRLQMKLRQN